MHQNIFLLFSILYFFSVPIYASDQCRAIDKVVSPATYKGKCLNGLANGYGVATHKKLVVMYKGQFKNGKFNGSGKLTSEQKDKTKKIWEGEWRNGQLNGYGEFTSSTLFAKGQWINGKLNGQGIEKNLSSGRVFKGHFKNNLWHKGRVTFSDGTYIQGQWVAGKLSGYVIETMKSGAVYKGQYRNGNRHGRGVVAFSDGTSTSGVWKNGKAISGNVMKLIQKPKHRAPRPKYRASAPIVGGVIESKIDGEFEGWEGDTVFKLMNGQIWQQSQYNYTYHYAYMPDVLIYPSNGGYKMKVDGVNTAIFVQRLR